MAEAALFIKHKSDSHSNPFMMSHSGYLNNHFGNPNEGVDPSDLTMQQNGFVPFSYGSQQNMSSSFNFGNSGIDTDELLDLEISGQNGVHRDNNVNYMQDQSGGIAMSHQSQMSHLYSNTPDNAPMASPFVNNSFNYEQFRMNQQNHHLHHANSFDQNYLNAKPRPSLQAMDRTSSDTRSPMTPKTPALGSLTLGTPESGSFPGQPIRTTGIQHRHQKSLSNQWDGTPGSAQSYIDSPLGSPNLHPHQLGISEIIQSGKHASLPAKVDNGHPPGSVQDLESQEAKRRRRRASHNLVERRRRDNINERIQDLSHLVPQHRLEDDKVRKQLVNSTALSMVGAGSNAATSLLAGGNGRRATPGNITMGLPIEDKEKGPNKGDILNGAVSWMRDLMWALHVKYQQEAELAEMISSLGGTWPFEPTEDEKRMRSEILDALEKNDPSSFSYTRGPGSGLRVPKHTNLAGDPVGSDGLTPPGLSPSFHSGGSSSNGGGQQQYWNSAGHAAMSFKEEDEYGMEMN
ncbi:hypothetical protein POX_d05732 [Penicillium oxalicum]|nr:hypothetical protein POX_d05732 [Penicillium oxalicum]KAI2790225.1 hypothetical protein POX_d05732 [Penicillium oxalicum]